MVVGFNVFVALEAGFAQTPDTVARQMLRIARLRRGDVFYDLGCGDGALLIMAAEEFGARAVGVEIQPKLVAYARQRIRDRGLTDDVEVIEGDLFRVSVHEADVVALYLAPWAMAKVRVKLEREARTGATIVAYKYLVDGWTPTDVHDAADGTDGAKLYRYAWSPRRARR